MPTIGQALAAARRTVDAMDARVLLGHALQKDAAYLAAHTDTPLTPQAADAFAAALSRCASGEPVAYITGRREFYGLEFRVTPAVLIPRPETELLVDIALARIPPGEECHVLVLGTGSGCIAISIAHERPKACVLAVDSSADALALARDNARALATGNVSLAIGDWFEAVAARCFNLIVANPPYVRDGDPHLARGDLRYEPRAALVAGGDGLAAIRHIVQHAGRHLVAGGTLLFEHGYDQGDACRALLQAGGWKGATTWRDLAGHERVSGGSAD